MKAVRMTSCSASGGRSAAAGDGTKAQRGAAGVGVEGGHELADGVVAVAPELHRVLDLLQGDHVGVDRVDRLDDLAALAAQVRVVPRTARAVGVAGVDRDRVVVAVEERRAGVGRRVQRHELGGRDREEVQHVEGGELDVAAHVGRPGRASVLDVDADAGAVVGNLLDRDSRRVPKLSL